MQEENPNNNNNREEKEIRLEGKLKGNIRPGKNENYYYAFMFSEELGRDVPLFFWKENFDYEKWLEIQGITQDQNIVVYGYEGQGRAGYEYPSFHVRRFEIDEEAEVF